MRGRPCSICQRNDPAIDAALSAGNHIVPTAVRFGVSKSALHRHKVGCLAPKIKAAAKAVQSTKEAKASVTRAKQIVNGDAVASVEDVLSLQGLQEMMVRSFARLEGSAKIAAANELHAALAAVTGQIHRGVETTAKLRGYYTEAPVQQGEKFSVNIVLSPPGAAQPVTIDGVRADPEDSAPRVPARSNVSYLFDTQAQDQDQD